ncbi:lysostaphin resistance A-like protein [Streptomyces sp. NPDC090085]|uniref:CPBP family intramembrane glutamic endopeptidase n=1 Tax=Streptomyces sp. NPDC090085 TaxID=3365943 RepID=UPI003808CB4E
MTSETTAPDAPPSPPAAAVPPGPPAYHRMARAAGRHDWWRPLAGTGLVVAGVFALMLGVFIASEVAGHLAGRSLDADGVVSWGTHADLALSLASIAVALPVVLLAAHAVQGRPAGTVSSVEGRLRWRRLAVCLGLALPLVLLTMAVLALLPAAPGENGSTQWAGTRAFLTGLAVLCVLVPFQAAAEEYVFRGWLLQAVGAWCRSPWVAVAPQAVLFAAAHGWGTVWGFADLVVFGAVTGWLTARTGGLEAAIALHVLNNLVSMGIAAAIAGALDAQETAADMHGAAVAVDVPLVLLYAAAVLWVTRRRERLRRDCPRREYLRRERPRRECLRRAAGPAGGV